MRDPRRILLVSATIGEGHNATARAVAEAARRCWPECEVSWVDALQVMGSWVPRTFQWIYATNVESTPWLYEFFYAVLWRHRWFADACRRFVGSWCGRRLRHQLATHRPDLVVSTYPMGTAGLDWLRQRGESRVPIAAVISDFAPHPFWVYPGIDLHYAMSEVSVDAARHASPHAVVEPCAPPVVADFAPSHKSKARREYDLPEKGFIALISCGAMSFGSVERAVDAALDVPALKRVIVACGHNERLRIRLHERSRQAPRLVPLGWMDDMPTLTGCADVVVTNAGGATALEALACGRAIVMFEPIAAHGRANAELMADAGLAELCTSPEELSHALHRLATWPDELTNAENAVLRHSTAHDFTDQIAALARLPSDGTRHTLRHQDAFFVYVAHEVPQSAGAVLELDEPVPRPESEWEAHLRRLVSERTPRLPMLRYRFIPRRGRRPVWTPVGAIQSEAHVRFQEVPSTRLAEVIAEFFAEPLATEQAPWNLMLVRDTDTNSRKLLAKLHHALGDGLAITTTLLDLLRDERIEPEAPGRAPTRISRPRRVTNLSRGLFSLASAGTAPSTGLRRRSTGQHRFTWGELPMHAVRDTANELAVGKTALLLTVLADALHRQLSSSVGTVPGQAMRIMVPRTAREANASLAGGNRTVAVSLDLPVGPEPVSVRLAHVTARLREAKRSHQAIAAGLVLSLLGKLPAPLHAWFVRTVYRGRFFGAIVSVMPGPTQAPRTADAGITKVFPMLPLAPDVGLSIGVMMWCDVVGFGITVDPGVIADVDRIMEHIHEAFTALATAAHGE